MPQTSRDTKKAVRAPLGTRATATGKPERLWVTLQALREFFSKVSNIGQKPYTSRSIIDFKLIGDTEGLVYRQQIMTSF